ncbi:glycosyltransferase family 2 protein [Chitinophaga sp. CC14]|uniref:tetratricopeptide repeat-containing glycosyltransferase n=1 Tax=Chitinophaga sp. CC14 TaxID=3029199 RepID=UPI003B8171E4
MKRIVLNFICKNEAHILQRMLSSLLPFVDMIVGVDTGSTDNSIAITESFGKQHNIPTFIFTRDFDNFCNSRNYALQMLRQKVEDKNWSMNKTWAITADCDETFEIEKDFVKQSLSDQCYMVRHITGHESFCRETVFRLDLPFFWQSPVHEFLSLPGLAMVRTNLPTIRIKVNPGGASWKGNLVQKYLNYASLLVEYDGESQPLFRTKYFIGDSFSTAAGYCNDRSKARELYEKAHDYYIQALKMKPDSREVYFLLLRKLGDNLEHISDCWPDRKHYYLQAFNHLLGRAETLSQIIVYYMDQKEWITANQYSWFCYYHFFLNKRLDTSIGYRDDSLYYWKLLFYYYLCCYHSGEKKKAKQLYKSLIHLEIENNVFTEKDAVWIRMNSPFLLKWRLNKEKLYYRARKIASIFKNKAISSTRPQTQTDVNYAS